MAIQKTCKELGNSRCVGTCDHDDTMKPGRILIYKIGRYGFLLLGSNESWSNKWLKPPYKIVLAPEMVPELRFSYYRRPVYMRLTKHGQNKPIVLVVDSGHCLARRMATAERITQAREMLEQWHD